MGPFGSTGSAASGSAAPSVAPAGSAPPGSAAPGAVSRGPAEPPHWGRQASLIQPREPAFWLYVVLLAVGGYFFYQEQALMSSLTTAYLLSWALVLVYAVPVALVVYRLDLFEAEPKILLAAAVIWGGIIATSLSAEANSAWLSVLGKVAAPDFTAQWGKAIVGPGVEETLKLMGVVILYLVARNEFDGPMDGFVYGAMVGLGFTVVEDVSYFINAVASAPGAVDQSGPVFDTFIIRVVGGGLYGHVLFTGLTGTGFAYLVTRRSASALKRVGAGACIVAGVAAHVVWNSPLMESILQTRDGTNPSALQWVEYGTAKGLPFLMLLVVLVLFATRSEENNFRAIVVGEPDPNVITEPEIRSLRSLLARRSARERAKRSHGPAGARLTGQLQAAQIEYALVRSRFDPAWDPEVERQRRRIRAIRAQLEALPPVGAVAVVSSSPAQPKSPAQANASSASPPTRPAQAAESTGSTEPNQPAQAAPMVGWQPTHLVPPGGMPAWLAPDPAQPPIAVLPERLDLVLEGSAGAWAHVRAVNGWQGWVDGRLLIPRR
jgi:RsiW-degrading membrane proteinase PrsW (M82 family)